MTMSLAKQLQFLGIGGFSRSMQAQIDEEMDFHIESRIEELMAGGLSRSAARSKAEGEFGNRRAHSKNCRRIQTGIHGWMVWGTVASLVAVTTVVGLLVVSLNEMRARNLDLVNQLKSSATSGMAVLPVSTSAETAVDNDLKGRVVNANGEGIAEAVILLVHKSWPGGRYNQQVHATETDKDGNYVFEELYSTGMQNAFLVTVMAEGHVMESRYKVEKRGKKSLDYNFKLKSAAPIRFEFVDGDGEALSEATVFVQSRRVRTKEHMAYFQSADDASFLTDEEGKVQLDFFVAGDKVNFAVEVVGDWVEKTVRIGKADTQKVVVKKN